MGFRFRVCKNDITDLLRQTFNATPLRVPETRVKPLIVVSRRGAKSDFRGELKYLLAGEPELGVDLQESQLANTALQRSQSIGLNFGLKILEGFLQGFNLSPSPVGASLKGVKEISFSFTNTKRIWVDPGQLGARLKGQVVDLKHPSVGLFTRPEDPFEMLLISDVIISNSFTVNIEKADEREFNAAMPALHTYAADASSAVKMEVKQGESVTFEGAQPLAFAFSCVLLDLNKNDGSLQVGETVLTKGGGKAEKSPYTLMDDDEYEPGMMEWD